MFLLLLIVTAFHEVEGCGLEADKHGPRQREMGAKCVPMYFFNPRGIFF